MLKYTNLFLLLLCIFLTLPFQSFTASSPTVTCHQRNSPIDKVFQQDCRNLIQKQILGSRGPLSSFTGWEEKVSASSQTKSIWSASSGSCVLGFLAQRPLSHETWNAIKSSIHAVVDECLDHKEPGGRQLQVPLQISRRGLTAEEEKTLKELHQAMRKSVGKMIAAPYGVILWRRHGGWYPGLGAGVLFGSATLFGQGLGGLATSSYAAGKIQSGSRDNELRRRSFGGGHPVDRLYPRAGGDTKPFKVTCLPASLPTNPAFKKDCRDVIQRYMTRSPGTSGGSSQWKEEMFPGFQISIWSASSEGCTISFSIPRPLSEKSWNTVTQNIEAIADTCVDKKGMGGSTGDFGDPFRQVRPKYPLVWIQETSQYINRKNMCRRVRFRSPSSLTLEEKRIHSACWTLYGATASAALGGVMMPANPTLAVGLYLYGALLGMQGSGEFNLATKLPDVKHVQAMSHLTGRGLGSRLSRHFLNKRLCRAVRFRKASSLTEGDKKIKTACWQMYGGSAWAAAGVGMIPVEPRLATGFLFGGVSLGVHGAKSLHDATRAPSRPLKRRSHISSASPSSPPPLHHPFSNDPAPPPSTPPLHRRGLCKEVLLLNPMWLTHDQKEMRSACIKMIASTAALTAGGWVGTRTNFSKIAVGLTAWGTVTGARGAKQFAKAKVNEFVRPLVSPLIIGMHG